MFRKEKMESWGETGDQGTGRKLGARSRSAGVPPAVAWASGPRHGISASRAFGLRQQRCRFGSRKRASGAACASKLAHQEKAVALDLTTDCTEIASRSATIPSRSGEKPPIDEAG